MSPPSPCSPSNLSLKTSFLPFIIFFPPLPSTSAAASRGLAWPGLESHVIFTVAAAWEKKREVCVGTVLWPSREVRGQLNADPMSSSHKRTDSILFCLSSLFLLFVMLSFFYSLLCGLWFDPNVSFGSLGLIAIRNAQMQLVNLNITRISVPSQREAPELDIEYSGNKNLSLYIHCSNGKKKLSV